MSAQAGDHAARHLGGLLGDHLDDTPLEFSDDFQINQRLGDVELQPQLLAYFARQSEDGVLQRPTVGPGLLRLVHGPAELLVDHPLDSLQPRVGVELLIDDLTGPFQGHHLGGGDTERLDALGDGGFANAELPRGVGLAVGGVRSITIDLP